MRVENSIPRYTLDRLKSVMSPEFRTFAIGKFVHAAPYSVMRFAERLVDLPIPDVVRRCPSLFVHIPKNAGTTISNALYGRFIGHRTAMWYRIADPQMFESKYRFAVVRDPIGRFISSFHFLQNGGKKLVPSSSRASNIVRRYRTIEEFMECVDADQLTNFKNIDLVFHDQHKYVVDTNGKVIVDDLFNLDKIKNTRLSVPGSVINMSIITNNSSIPLSARSRRIKEFVEKQYALDYELLAL